jgi:hypothetical protein
MRMRGYPTMKAEEEEEEDEGQGDGGRGGKKRGRGPNLWLRPAGETTPSVSSRLGSVARSLVGSFDPPEKPGAAV